jgi:hypothetical protein
MRKPLLIGFLTIGLILIVIAVMIMLRRSEGSSKQSLSGTATVQAIFATHTALHNFLLTPETPIPPTRTLPPKEISTVTANAATNAARQNEFWSNVTKTVQASSR